MSDIRPPSDTSPKSDAGIAPVGRAIPDCIKMRWLPVAILRGYAEYERTSAAVRKVFEPRPPVDGIAR